MKRYLLYLSYIGSKYRGVQRQLPSYLEPDVVTVQGLLENAVIKCFKPVNPISVVTSSRTDSGVHALRTAVHVDLEPISYLVPKFENPVEITNRLNSHFRKSEIDIRIQKTQEVPLTFHSRHNAVRRTYLYRIGAQKKCFESTTQETWSYCYPISEHERTYIIQDPQFEAERMLEVLDLFQGTKDYRVFMGRPSSQPDDKITVQNITLNISASNSLLGDLDPYNQYYNYWNVLCSSRSFLYREVRRIVSVLIAVGRNRMSYDDVKHLFDKPVSESWNPRASVVPPYGLYLINVEYNDEDLILKEGTEEEQHSESAQIVLESQENKAQQG